MKHTGKRILALALALCLGASVLPGAALAAEEAPQRGVLTYTEHIAPQYEQAQLFSEDLAAVKKDGKWGYIDTDGNTVIPFQYDLAFRFSEGLAVVGELYRSYETFEYEYDPELDDYVEVGPYTNNVYELGFIDQTNAYTPFHVEYRSDPETYEDLGPGPMLEVSKEGHEYDIDDMLFYNGTVPIWHPDSPDCSLFGTDGTVVVSYDSYGWQVTEGYAITGLAFVYGGDQGYYNMDTGETMYIDLVGVDPDTGEYWTELRPFNQGLAPVGVCGYDSFGEWVSKWGFVNTAGQWVIQPAYSNFMITGMNTHYKVFGETGLAMMCNAEGKWGAIDKTGATVIPFQYDGLRPYHFGLAPFNLDGKYGYLDGQGQVAIPAQYVVTSGFGSNGYAVAYDGTRAFLIDAEGKEIPDADTLDPDTYFTFQEDDDVPETHTPDEYVIIEEGGKYGFGHVEYLPALPEQSEMSSWAYEEVVAAIEEDLVPTYLQNLYLNNINREEFCDLVIQAVEEVLGQDIADVVLDQTGQTLSAWQGAYPFTDTTSSNVIAANALGIINGRGDGIFDPYATITRQEAAALLMRAAQVLGMDTSAVESADFVDGDSVGVWFTDAVNFVYQINVMGGTSSEALTFSPLGTYTREQSYMTIYRLFQAIVQQ